MALTIGIVGLPNVGKSTLFNAITKQTALVANYAFATIDPNIGIVELPDERLEVLEKMFNSKKVVHATVDFVDIAGIVKGASRGEGLGNKFLANIREANALCHVVRAFETGDISHVEGGVDPKRDIEIIQNELILADLQTLEKVIPRLEKEARGDKAKNAELEAAKAVKSELETGKLSAGLISAAKELQLMSAKPVIYVFNVSESELGDEALKSQLRELAAPNQALFIDAQLESELIDLSPEDAIELLKELGQDSSGLSKLAKAGFEALQLQTFLTAGEKETRAWEIAKGSKAPQAAGVIHTDFERGFIRAQVVSYDDLISAGSMLEAKNRGRIRSEGKDYIMQEGDIAEFFFNV